MCTYIIHTYVQILLYVNAHCHCVSEDQQQYHSLVELGVVLPIQVTNSWISTSRNQFYVQVCACIFHAFSNLQVSLNEVQVVSEDCCAAVTNIGTCLVNVNSTHRGCLTHLLADR